MAQEQLSDLARIVEDGSASNQDRIVAQFVINSLADFQERGLLSMQQRPEPVGSVGLSARSAAEDVNPLTSVIEAYRNQPHTPELVTQTHQAIWETRRKPDGTTYEVTPCTYTQEQLAALEAEGDALGYLPPGLETQEDRPKLGAMFPKMQRNSVQEGNKVTNDQNPSGWFRCEAAIDAPYTDTTEAQLMARLEKAGRRLLSENQYIVAGQDSKILTGRYLDEAGTWARLGSRFDGRMVYAGFFKDGYLHVFSDLGPGNHDPDFGARSSGVNNS